MSTAATATATVAGVEVQFRRANRDYLIVAIGGRLIVRA